MWFAPIFRTVVLAYDLGGTGPPSPQSRVTQCSLNLSKRGNGLNIAGHDTQGLASTLHTIGAKRALRSGLGTNVVYHFAMINDGICVEDFGKLSHLSKGVSWLCTYLRNDRNNYAAMGGKRDLGTLSSAPRYGTTRSRGTAQASTSAKRLSMMATEVSFSHVLEWFCLIAAGV